MKEKYYVSPQPTTTTFISGESITINSTKPNKLAENIFATGLSTDQPKLTEQEIFKKFEELGYEHRTKKEYPHMIYLVNDDDEPKWTLSIKINIESKKYWKVWGDLSVEAFTFEEHQLLTELFKYYK